MKVPELRLADLDRPRGDGVGIPPVELVDNERRCRRSGQEASVGDETGELERERGVWILEKKLDWR